MAVKPQGNAEARKPMPSQTQASRHELDDGSSSLRRLAALVKPYTGRLITALVMLFALTAVNMAPPLLIQQLVDRVLDAGQLGRLWLILGGFISVYLLRNILYFNSKMAAVRVGEKVSFTLRKRLFERMQQMNLQFYRQTQPGKISSRVMDDSFVVQSFIQDEVPSLLQALLLFLGLVAVLYAMNWQLAMAATIVLPFHLAAAKWFRTPIKRASREAQKQLSVVHGNLIEQFLGAEVVKGFTAERRENEAFERAIDVSRESQIRSKTYHVWQKVVADLLIGLGLLALIALAALEAVRGNMSTGRFIQFFSYVMMLYPNVLELMSGFAKLTRSTASIDRVFEMLSADQIEHAATRPITRPVRGRVQFDSVSFRYGDGPPVLKNINLLVPAGQVCAIVGPSGAGKSTLTSLVPRFNDPSLGSVKVDDIDVRDYDLTFLRSSIGMAFQECFLFNSSIFENLRYARPDATMNQIIEVAQRTGAHDFITRLPQGYATVIGEDGVSLSRGEKQRITLTRAMLKNPRILILDEATASIDVASEQRIIPAILEFMQGKTTLMITHNPELMTHADVVVKLVDGRVIFEGQPDELADDILAGTDTSSSTPSATDRQDQSAAEKKAAEEAEQESDQALGSSGVWRSMQVWPLIAALMLALGGGVRAAETESPSGGSFMPLTGLNLLETEELIDVAIARAQIQFGYERAANALAADLPRQSPQNLERLTTLARTSDQGLHVLQLGYKSFRSQPPHIWVGGTLLKDEQHITNEDIAAVEQIISQARQTLAEQYEQVTIADLDNERITLSYVEADRCVGMLKSLGYQCIEFKDAGNGLGKARMIEPTKQIDPKTLPIVIAIPAPNAVDLVGGAGATSGTFGLKMTPSIASELPEPTTAAPVMDLLVMYHPAHPEQFSDVLDLVRTTIDTPAQQILIEAMVLEISETGLDQLGVEWELTTPISDYAFVHNVDELKFGKLPTFDSGGPTAELEMGNVFGHFKMRLEALVRDGQAEILSRPSVLTLDNRQASIRVGEEVPVATSASGLRGGDKISFDFEYIPIGILLNVRPRIAADSEEVSMQIDGIVSAEVPGEDLIILDQSDPPNQVARAPRISTRRVQTYARIANNTPFIIGGLVSRDDTRTLNKVPLLGDLPLVGGLFRSEEINTSKREVIIVITPYVLPDNKTIGRNMPKDEDAFDSFGHQLFRDAYRIRSEDVFDLGFLLDNRQLNEYKRLAGVAVRGDFRLADRYPFNRFVGYRVPGERILVFRQMYEVIKRLNIDQRVTLDKLIFFERDDESTTGFNVRFLWAYLAKLAGLDGNVNHAKAFFDALDGRALAMTYTLRSDDVTEVLSQPVPDVRLIDCPNWDRALWELNQPDEMGRPRFTILLQKPSHLERLQRAIVLKRTVQLNANRQALTLVNFSVGRLLLMPEVSPDKVYLIDEDTAKYFFYTEQYYAALEKELIRDLEALRAAMVTPEVSRHLTEPVPQVDPSAPLITLPRPAE
jgi:subfamily B ATP-binding cassette protein MsbA